MENKICKAYAPEKLAKVQFSQVYGSERRSTSQSRSEERSTYQKKCPCKKLIADLPMCWPFP